MSAPRRRDRTRPAELVGLAGGVAVFVGLFVLLGTRQITLALIFSGVAFVVSLVVLAMLLLAATPRDGEEAGDDPDRPSGH
jgi:hypothetical protein